MKRKTRSMRNAIGLVLLLAATVAADLEVWKQSDLQEVFPLGGSQGLRLITMSTFVGWGRYSWLALVSERSAMLPDSFCVHGDALVSPADYSDTLDTAGRVQILTMGPMVRLDTALSQPPDTVVLQLVSHPYGAEADSSTATWVLDAGAYRRLPPTMVPRWCQALELNGDYVGNTVQMSWRREFLPGNR